MITNLLIQNYILIDHLQLDLKQGFSVFTGETGAGKSILIDAIGLLCGDRANSSVVRKGKNKAIIEGMFDLHNNPIAQSYLQEAGFDDVEEVIVTREINAEGKSVVRINHRLATLSLVKDVLSNEIDIHSQHDNQYLLNSKNHISLLDEYMMKEELLQSLKEKYSVYASLKKELEQTLHSDYNEADIQLLEYEIKEIEKVNPVVGEDEELEELAHKMANFEKTLDKINETMTLVEKTEILENLYEAAKLIGSSDDDQLNQIGSTLLDKYYELEESFDQIKEVRGSLDFDEEQINDVQTRLFEINKLKRRFGNTIEKILNRKEELKESIHRIENRQEYLDMMERKVKIAFGDFEKIAKKVREERIKASISLEKQITEHMKQLMLPNARFKVSVVESKNPSSTGLDQVEFLISMNKGMELESLNKAASGGELSRLMLGLKTIFTRYQKIGTVIFDEIDTGVSGSVATAIGLNMSTLSKDAQVFSVTHLSQVAACADAHYFVSKQDDGQITTSQIHLLDEEERIHELATISSGVVTDSSYKAAKELLLTNQKLVCGK